MILSVGGIVVQVLLARRPLRWVISGQLTRLSGLGPRNFAALLGLIALLWVPRVVDVARPKEVDRARINWGELLWDGNALTIDIGDLPDHARGSLLIEGESYTVRFHRDSCEWESSGPIKHPTAGTVTRHFNRAGPKVKPYLGIQDSGTSTAECNSPRDRKLIVAGLPVDFDRRGNLSFGGAVHRIGEIRLP
jgi:hypothetical protein